MFYTSRYVHAYNPRPNDTGHPVKLGPTDTADRRALGAALRKARILCKGDFVHEYRIENDGRIVVFPRPMCGGMWHSVILSPLPVE